MTYSCLICYIISLECISRLRFGYGSSEFVINVFAVSVFYFILFYKRWNCVCSFRQENMQIKISIVSTWSYLTFRIVDWITNYVIQFKSRITINIKKCVSVNKALKIRIKRASKQLYFALKLYKFDYDCWVQAILVYWMFTNSLSLI